MDTRNTAAGRCFVMVYLTPEQKAELSVRAAIMKTSLSAYARDKLLDAPGVEQPTQWSETAAVLGRHTELLQRIETLAAAAVLSPVVAVIPPDAPQAARVSRIREVMTLALQGAHRVRARLGPQGEYQAVEASHE